MIKSAEKNTKPTGGITKKDLLIMLLLFAVSALFIFVYLGGTAVPQTYWEAKRGGRLSITLQKVEEISDIRIYSSVPAESGKLVFELHNLATSESSRYDYFADGGNIYCWNGVIADGKITSSDRVFIEVASGSLRISEIVLVSKDGGIIYFEADAVTDLSGGQNALAAFDEQNLLPKSNSLMTDMYFDEIYHARTAFEQINGFEIYEWTHPPLGKTIISLGIRLFGMNPFGWRFMSALFGCLIVPLIYLFGKKLFGSTLYAALLALFISFDGLHLTLSRIATLDSIAVFFMVLTYYFMLCFYKTNARKNDAAFKKSLLYLALSGITFGAAAAVKWTNVYAGLGLLAIFLYTLIRGVRAGATANAATVPPQNAVPAAVATAIPTAAAPAPPNNKPSAASRFAAPDVLASAAADGKPYAALCGNDKKYLLYTVLTAFTAFVLIGGLIYTLSYIPYLKSVRGKSLFQIMLDNQSAMLHYHSGISELHNSQSSYFTWPLNLQGVFFYMADGLNTYSRIHCLGTSSLYIFGLFSVILSAVYIASLYYRKIKYKTKFDKNQKRNLRLLIFLFCGFLSCYLPWVIVPRYTFLYHYYGSLIFVLCLSVFCLKLIAETYSRTLRQTNFKILKKTVSLNISGGGIIAGALIAVFIVNFLLMLPAFTGYPINYDTAKIMFLWLNNGYGFK
jgi:predicted membrane-bound dolichyl-phosphate-mannose-protein mannosyltransferase